MANQEAKGIQRIINATRYSKQGLEACYKHEEAFRQELILVLVFSIIAPFVTETLWQAAILWFAAIMILIVELLNSAVEAVVDRFGGEIHELSGRAKDIGSAAVGLVLIANTVLWAVTLFEFFKTLFNF